MKNNFRLRGPTGKKILGLSLILLAIAIMVWWEMVGREMLLYDQLLVLKEDTEKGTIITEEMLETRHLLGSEGALQSASMVSLIGKETTQFVKGGEGIYKEYFDEAELVANENQDRFILSIPNQWLLSYPQSLRRGDTANFYCKGERVISARVAYAKNNSNQEVTSVDQERLQGTSTISLVEVVVDKQQAQRLSSMAEAGERFIILYN